MTIQDLGSLGELVAAIATVFTLAYLALQIRQNTRTLEQASERATIEDSSRWRSKLIQSPEIANLYRKGTLEPESLDPIEKLRFRMLMDDLFYHWQSEHKNRPDSQQGHVMFIGPTLATPGGAQYWQRAKPQFTSAFIEHVNRALNAKGADRATSAA